VPKHMWGDAFLPQRWASLSCLRQVPSEHVLNSIGAQAAATLARKQSFGIFSALFPNPGLEHHDGRLGQGSTTFLASFPLATNIGASTEPDVFVPQSGHLG
jgi:hypothetical protein